jgi:hypothetical protein
MRMRDLPAFRTTGVLLILLGLSVVFGGITGWLFLSGSTSMAWLNYIFSFMQVLGMGFFYCVWLSFRVRLPKGAWRAASHVGFSTIFPMATLYMATVFLFTFTMPLGMVTLPNNQVVLNRPDYLNNFGILYGCALIVACFACPVYAVMSPFRVPVLVTMTGTERESEPVPLAEVMMESQQEEVIQ